MYTWYILGSDHRRVKYDRDSSTGFPKYGGGRNLETFDRPQKGEKRVLAKHALVS